MQGTKLYLGVDPDSTKSGIALWDASEKKLLECKSVNFFEVLHLLDIIKDQKGIAHIEAGWLNKKSNFHSAQGSSVREKIAKNVGHCEMVSKLLIEYCDLHNIRYRTIKPTRSKEQNNYIFKQSGWTGRTSQDVRDAVALVYGF